MSVQYTISNTDEFSGITLIFPDGTVQTAQKGHPAYDEIRKLLLSDDDVTEELLELINPIVGISNKLTALSERVSYNGQDLLFDNDVLDTALTEHIVRLLKESEGAEERNTGYKHFVKFLEKLQTNPSSKSREHLFHFVKRNGITITEDGDMLLYKGVRNDGKSVSSGYGIVNGEVFEKANLDNSVGNLVEIPRSMVDDNRNVACSNGLHAGDYSYASTFHAGGILLRVLVSPRDVVSVPSDASDRKVRINRYIVLEANPNNYTKPTIVLRPEPTRDEILEEVLNTIIDEEEIITEVTIAPVQDVIPETEEPAPLLGVVAPPLHGPAETAALDFANRVEAMEKFIGTLDDTSGKALRRQRNKKITRKNREPFDLAVSNLGLSYS